jgi:hypothetical protein
MQTTAAFAALATGTSIKTLLQYKASASILGKIVEWGISFDGTTAATPGKVELIETNVAATVTAADANSITPIDANATAGGNPTSNLIPVGTSATGYNASAEGTITEVRNLDLQLIAPTNQYVKQFPLGREPVIRPDKFARIRVHFGASVNAYAYMIVEV